jgi:hypothetical protein
MKAKLKKTFKNRFTKMNSNGFLQNKQTNKLCCDLFILTRTKFKKELLKMNSPKRIPMNFKSPKLRRTVL